VSDVAEDVTSAVQPVSLIAKPDVPSEPPIACTLDAASLKGRVEEWAALLEHVSRREPVDDGLRLTFAPGAPAGELIRLVAAEQGCCQFFRFAITVDGRGIALEARAPTDAQEIVHSLFGESRNDS